MRTLLILRDAGKQLYANYDYIIIPLSKFLLALISLIVLQGRLGYMEALSSISVILICSVLCMFLPFGFISFICALFLIADMFAVSYAMAAFGTILFLIIFVMYFGFRPGTGVLMSIVPLLFFLRVPFMVPLLLGMTMGLTSIIPTVLGVLIYYLIHYFSQNVSDLSNQGGLDELLSMFLSITRSVLMNRYMYVIMAGFAFSIVVVYLLSHSNLDHAWTIATLSGAGVLLIIVILADIRFGGDLFIDVIGVFVSFALAFVYEIVFYKLDYKHTEYLRFEDDDYFYYVKAVPKVKSEDEDLRRE